MNNNNESTKKVIKLNLSYLLLLCCLFFCIVYGIDIISHFDDYTTFQKIYKPSVFFISLLNIVQYLIFKYIIKNDRDKKGKLFINLLVSIVALFIPFLNIIVFIVLFAINLYEFKLKNNINFEIEV